MDRLFSINSVPIQYWRNGLDNNKIIDAIRKFNNIEENIPFFKKLYNFEQLATAITSLAAGRKDWKILELT